MNDRVTYKMTIANVHQTVFRTLPRIPEAQRVSRIAHDVAPLNERAFLKELNPQSMPEIEAPIFLEVSKYHYSPPPEPYP